MARLLGNTIVYAAATNRRVIPVAHNHSAFGLPFYDVFEPVSNSGPMADKYESAQVLRSRIMLDPFGDTVVGELSATWRAEADHKSTNGAHRTSYALQLGRRTAEYALAIDVRQQEFPGIQLTTGEYAHTSRYKVSSRLFEDCQLSERFKSYIVDRSKIFDPNCVAVHWRNTPDKMEPIEKLTSEVASALNFCPTANIFLATDNSLSRNELQCRFPTTSVLTLTPLPDLTQGHFRNLHSIPESQLLSQLGITKADQIGYALADIWCLSRGQHFVPSNSEFSKLSAMFRSAPVLIGRFFGSPDS